MAAAREEEDEPDDRRGEVKAARRGRRSRGGIAGFQEAAARALPLFPDRALIMGASAVAPTAWRLTGSGGARRFRPIAEETGDVLTQ